MMLVVTYKGVKDCQFDREYYCSHHLPLVKELWGPYGMETIAAFFPQDNVALAGEETGIIALCLCGFRDDAALRKALASADTPTIMDDLQHFTGLQPNQSVLCSVHLETPESET